MKEKTDIIRQLIKREYRKRPKGPCPDEEALAGFIAGGLSEPYAEKILSHVARCTSCAETAALVRTLEGEQEKEESALVPHGLIEKAKGLDPANKGVMDVVIRFAKGVAEVIRAGTDVKGGRIPALEAVRGEDKVVSENLVILTKPFPPFLAEVEVERTRPELAEITVRLTDGQGSHPPGVRVSVFEDEVEIESNLLSEGAAVFENLKFGQYRLEITRRGEPVGRIALDMKGEGK